MFIVSIKFCVKSSHITTLFAVSVFYDKNDAFQLTYL